MLSLHIVGAGCHVVGCYGRGTLKRAWQQVIPRINKAESIKKFLTKFFIFRYNVLSCFSFYIKILSLPSKNFTPLLHNRRKKFLAMKPIVIFLCSALLFIANTSFHGKKFSNSYYIVIDKSKYELS